MLVTGCLSPYQTMRPIADHRAVFGVEPICAVLPIAPSTYHRHRHQRTHPTRRSARAQRDDQLRIEIQRVYDAHQQVYGPRKVWKQLPKSHWANPSSGTLR